MTVYQTIDVLLAETYLACLNYETKLNGIVIDVRSRGPWSMLTGGTVLRP